MVHINFFYLRFELYPNSPSSFAQIIKKAKDLKGAAWVPPPDSDIFSMNDWPTHEVKILTALGGELSNQKVHESHSSSYFPFNLGEKPDRERAKESIDSKGVVDVSTCSRLDRRDIVFGSRKDIGALVNVNDKITRTNAVTQLENLLKAEKDWRFGRTAILGIDRKMKTYLEEDKSLGKQIREDELGEPEQSNSVKYTSSITSDLSPEGRRMGKVTRAQLEPIVGKSTLVGWGVVHLYRDDKEALHRDPQTTIEGVTDECTILCIPAVPSYLTPNYFLTWVGERTIEQVSHFRMVMTENSMRYLVLMKFRNAETAKSWKEEWNGRPFNCMESETCHVVFIKSISFSTTPSRTIPSPNSFPALKHDPFTPPTAPLIELPTCPVCLERMDETTGLLTISCQHVFHCTCLMKWKDSSCPVCRHTSPSSIDSTQEPPFGSGEASLCITCNCTDDLWICLICGNIGCGRYKGGHAKEHWKETAHCFALEIETQHVWDYAGDIWVHRLLRDKGDSSKLIDLPSRPRRGLGSDEVDLSDGHSDGSLISRNKLHVLSIEYTDLLTSQLESQRIYFENLISKSIAEAASASLKAASATLSASTAMEKIEALKQANADLKSELTEHSRNLEREKRRADKSDDLIRTLRKNLTEERHVGEGLMKRIEHLNCNIEIMTKEHDRLEVENCELRDTNRDLLFCLSAGEKVKEIEASESSGLVPGELEAGVLSLPNLTREKSKKESTKKKAKGKRRAQ